MAPAGAESEKQWAWTEGPQFLGQASCHATGTAFYSGGGGGGDSGRGWKPESPLWAPLSPGNGVERSH